MKSWRRVSNNTQNTAQEEREHSAPPASSIGKNLWSPIIRASVSTQSVPLFPHNGARQAPFLIPSLFSSLPLSQENRENLLNTHTHTHVCTHTHSWCHVGIDGGKKLTRTQVPSSLAVGIFITDQRIFCYLRVTRKGTGLALMPNVLQGQGRHRIGLKDNGRQTKVAL